MLSVAHIPALALCMQRPQKNVDMIVVTQGILLGWWWVLCNMVKLRLHSGCVAAAWLCCAVMLCLCLGVGLWWVDLLWPLLCGSLLSIVNVQVVPAKKRVHKLDSRDPQHICQETARQTGRRRLVV